MGKRAKPYQPKPFESDGSAGDTSANIYHSMLVHPKYKALSPTAKALYQCCKAQYYAEREKPVPKDENLTESEQARCFTMNRQKWHDTYGLYKCNNSFYKDMKMLIQLGFVDIIENGKVTRTKNIYMLSARWHKV